MEVKRTIKFSIFNRYYTYMPEACATSNGKQSFTFEKLKERKSS